MHGGAGTGLNDRYACAKRLGAYLKRESVQAIDRSQVREEVVECLLWHVCVCFR